MKKITILTLFIFILAGCSQQDQQEIDKLKSENKSLGEALENQNNVLIEEDTEEVEETKISDENIRKMMEFLSDTYTKSNVKDYRHFNSLLSDDLKKSLNGADYTQRSSRDIKIDDIKIYQSLADKNSDEFLYKVNFQSIIEEQKDIGKIEEIGIITLEEDKIKDIEVISHIEKD